MRRTRWQHIVTWVALAGSASLGHSQTWEPNGAELRFQIWNGSAWASSVPMVGGQRYEWRAVVTYTGTRTDLFALAEAIYQPIISSADISGGPIDSLGLFRGPIDTGNAIPGTILSATEGNNPGALASYGRVTYGLGATSAANLNIPSVFFHSTGNAGAPPGDYMRIAGSFVVNWPRALSGPVPPLDVTPTDINNILRGVQSSQSSYAQQSQFHVAGTQNLVVYRQSLTLSSEDIGRSQVVLTTIPESFKRWGSTAGATEGDDRRYIAWQTGPGDTGTGAAGHRTSVVIVPATIDPPPTHITVQPHFVDNGTGPLGDFRIQLMAAGGGPITYQWRLNGVPISNTSGRFDGTNSASLSVLAWSLSDFGDYDCVITSPSGVLTSEVYHFSRPTVPAGGPVSVEPIVIGTIGHPTSSGDWLSNTLTIDSGPPQVVIQGQVAASPGPNSPRVPVFQEWQPGSWTRLLTEGTPAPGPGVDSYWASMQLMDARNHTLLFESTNTDFWLKSAWRMDNGVPALLTAAGRPAPGLPGFTLESSGLNGGCVAPDGTVYFSQYVTNGTPNQTAWWFAQPGAAPQAFAKAGDPMPGLDATLFSSTSSITASANGLVAWSQAFRRPGQAYNGELGVWRGSPGDWDLVLASGSAVANVPAEWSLLWPNEVLFTDTGMLATLATFRLPGQTQFASRVVRSQLNEPPTAVATPGTILPLQNSSGWFVLGADVRGAGADNLLLSIAGYPADCSSNCAEATQTDQWIAFADGRFERAWEQNTVPSLGLLPGSTAACNGAELNSSGVVLFTAAVGLSQRSYPGLFGWTRDSGLFVIATPGSQFEVAPGVYRTVESAYLPMRTSPSIPTRHLRESGAFVFRVVFAGGPDSLFVGNIANFARAWHPCPVVYVQPHNTATVSNAQCTFAIEAAGEGTLSFRWRRNGIPLSDGMSPGGGIISGASTNALHFTGAQPSDSGQYACEVTNSCGTTVSDFAELTVTSVCDSIDFNRDGLFPDTADIDDFLVVFSGGLCSNEPNCGDIDFNNDALFPDTTDIDSLLSVFSGGPCI